MAKQASGMHHKSDRKTRGRSAISGKVSSREMKAGDIGPRATRPQVPIDVRASANRPVTANGSGNKHRGDRRDMSATYTGNAKHAARGNTPRKDVKTRKR